MKETPIRQFIKDWSNLQQFADKYIDYRVAILKTDEHIKDDEEALVMAEDEMFCAYELIFVGRPTVPNDYELNVMDNICDFISVRRNIHWFDLI